MGDSQLPVCQTLKPNLQSIPVHRHSLRVAAELPLSCRADGPAATTSSASAALLQRQKLLGAEGLVVDLAGRLDQVLEVGARKEVSQVDEFAVVLVLDVNDTPAVLPATDLLAVDNDVLLTAHDGERDDVLHG